MSVVADVLAALDRLRWWNDLKHAPPKIAELEKRIAALEKAAQPADTREVCPFCRQGRFDLIDEMPDPMFGDVGVMRRTFVCSVCRKTTSRQREP